MKSKFGNGNFIVLLAYFVKIRDCLPSSNANTRLTFDSWIAAGTSLGYDSDQYVDQELVLQRTIERGQIVRRIFDLINRKECFTIKNEHCEGTAKHDS